jgi:hypothetical protein
MTNDIHRAMTTAELEASRDACALGDSAAELFTIWTGKKATRIVADTVEIEFPYTGMLKHGVTNTIRVGAKYLIENMNAFAEGRRP